MRYSLLEMVQLILSSMDSDEVNSISDTVESNQVALILKSVYYDIATDIGLPEHETLFELIASGSSSRPTLMTVPSNVVTLRSVKYDYRGNEDTYSDFREIVYKPFDDFLLWTTGFRNEDEAVGEMQVTMNGEVFPFMYRSDRHPTYYTTADDNIILFDSYDATIDSTLQKSKTMCLGNVYPSFSMTDDFTPDLDPSQFSLFINRAKVRAFNELKQQLNEEAAMEARRQKIIVQKRKNKVPDVAPVRKAPQYGRK